MKLRSASPSPSPSSVCRVTSLYGAPSALYSRASTPCQRNAAALSTFDRSRIAHPPDGVDEPPARSGQVTLSVEAAPDEQNSVHPVALDPVGGTRHVHAAARHGERRSQRTERLAEVRVDRLAGGLGKIEPPPGVGIDHTVRAGDPEDLSVQDLGEDTVVRLEEHTRHGGMCEHGLSGTARDPAHRVETDDERRDHHAPTPGRTRE